MKKKMFAMIMIAMLGLLMTGCGNSLEENGPVPENGDSADNQTVIKQYFASAEYVTNGQDEENGELMPPVEFNLEVAEGENIYIATVNSLMNLPGVEEKDKYCTMVESRFVINDITVGDGLAYVDFSSADLNGGSTTEVILIDQIVYTLANSFEEIAAVKFTVDGNAADTLMGHVDTSEPFVADYL